MYMCLYIFYMQYNDHTYKTHLFYMIIEESKAIINGFFERQNSSRFYGLYK